MSVRILSLMTFLLTLGCKLVKESSFEVPDNTCAAFEYHLTRVL